MPMPLPVPGPLVIQHRHRLLGFSGTGRPRLHVAGRRAPATTRRRGRYVRENPLKYPAMTDVWAARLIVGFNVKGIRELTEEFFVKTVLRIRMKQTGDPSTSIVSQKGFYLSDDGKTIIREPGAQAYWIWFGSDKEPTPEHFIGHMQRMAEQVAWDMQQEGVILEILHNNRTESTGVWMAPTHWVRPVLSRVRGMKGRVVRRRKTQRAPLRRVAAKAA